MSLLRTVADLSRVLFIDSEAGDLPVQDLPVDTIRRRLADGTRHRSSYRWAQSVIRADQLL
jgi:hypothetical protein